jgi:hypothetical protein
MKNFLRQIQRSIYDPEYYSSVIIPGTNGDSVKYYLKLVALLALVVTVIVSILFLPRLVPLVRQGGEKIINYYPEGLEIYIKGGKASTNMVEPYIMPMPKDNNLDNKIGLKNLFVIDTKTPFSIEQFEKYNTAILLKQDAVYYYGSYENQGGKLNRGQTNFESLSKVPDITINKALASRFLSELLPVVKFLVPLLVPIIFLWVCLVLVWLLVYLFFASLFVWIVARIRRFPLTYGQAYRVSAHAITLPLIVYCLLFPVFWPLPPFVLTLVLVILAHLNLKKNTQPTLPLEQI